MTWETVDPPKDEHEVQTRHEANRRAWNEGAVTYTKELGLVLSELKKKESSLHPVERRNLRQFGELSTWCRRAVHLQCASGRDTLSLLIEGAAEVIGIDISDVHISNARWLTEQLSARASWIRCDVLDVPASLSGTADLVYTGRGALTWIQDITGWAENAAMLLKPGGVFSLLDDHPFGWLISQDYSDMVFSGADYFTFAERNTGWPDTYIGTLNIDQEGEKFERLWTISDVVQALIDAGLCIRSLGEHNEEYWDGFSNLNPDIKKKLPMTFSVIAIKPKST